MARAFLLMPFDSALEWLREVIVSAGAEVGVEVTRADDVFEAGVVIDQIERDIREADAVIAICTGRNPNVFYELGLARHYHSPILVAARQDEVPFDVRHRRIQYYDSQELAGSAEFAENLKRALVETISARQARPIEPQLLLTRYGNIASTTGLPSYSKMRVTLGIANASDTPASLWWVEVITPPGARSTIALPRSGIIKDRDRSMVGWRADGTTDQIGPGPVHPMEPPFNVQLVHEEDPLSLEYSMGAQGTTTSVGTILIGFRDGAAFADVGDPLPHH